MSRRFSKDEVQVAKKYAGKKKKSINIFSHEEKARATHLIKKVPRVRDAVVGSGRHCRIVRE